MGEYRNAIESFKNAVKFGYDDQAKIAEYISLLESKIAEEEALSQLLDDSGLDASRCYDAGISYEIGRLYSDLGDYEKAIKCFELGRKFALVVESGFPEEYKDLLSNVLPEGEIYGAPLGETGSRTSSVSSANDSGVFE